MIIDFSFRNCCTGVFRFFYMAEFDLDKNLLNILSPIMIKICHLFLLILKERIWGLLTPRKNILFSSTPLPFY